MLSKSLRLSLITILSLVSLNATQLKDIEVYANNITQNEHNVSINGNILINYKGKILTAKDGFYNRDTKVLILKNDVILIDNSGKRVNAKELQVNLNNEKTSFKYFFEIDKNDIWISALKATKFANNIYLQNALFSSCEVINPDWKIGFKKAKYDTKSDELKLYQATIYAKDFPILYLPYIYIPLSKKRRSGLLFPTFKYINKEGFLYSQPIYWAINKSQDLELDPQIRINRGFGLFATYRFVDNRDSSGKIKIGYFKDKSSYQKKYNLKYGKHYGAELLYINNSLVDYLSKNGFENKLYINGIYLSDNEYTNLQVEDKIAHLKLGSFYESRLNYYIKNRYFYSGISFRYFKDTTKDSNKDTIQILPQIDFKLPYRNLIYNNISYSFETQITNYTRESGSKALKISARLPIDFHFSIFNNLLGINVSNEFVATGYDFYNVPLNQKKYSSIVSNLTIGLNIDLINSYSFGTLVSMYSATYTKSSIITQDYMKYSQIPNDLKINYVDDVPFDSKIAFRTHQILNTNFGLNIDYILQLNYYPSENRVRDLTQELNIDYKRFSFYSKLDYSFVHKQATDIYNSISYKTPKYGFTLGYLWKKDILSFQTQTRELSLSTYYNYNNNLKFNASIAYNIKNHILKNWEINTHYKRKCWRVDIGIGENVRPIIKSNGDNGSISNKYVKFQFKLLPFGG